MYVYSITYSLILITSSAVILNSPINLFCPLDIALVLTSDNFLFNFHPSLPLLQPPVGTFRKLSSDVIFVVYSCTFALFWLRKTSVTVKIFWISFCVFVCAFPSEVSSIFGKNFPFPFPYFVNYYIIYNNYIFFDITQL